MSPTPLPQMLDDPAVLPCADGVLWIPAALPVRVPRAVYGLTVAEWLNLNQEDEKT